MYFVISFRCYLMLISAFQVMGTTFGSPCPSPGYHCHKLVYIKLPSPARFITIH
jgi:hypothetical protein